MSQLNDVDSPQALKGPLGTPGPSRTETEGSERPGEQGGRRLKPHVFSLATEEAATDTLVTSPEQLEAHLVMMRVAVAATMQTERKRLSRTLHDDLVQSLTLARLHLSLVIPKLSDPMLITDLQAVSAELVESAVAIRNLMTTLDTPLLSRVHGPITDQEARESLDPQPGAVDQEPGLRDALALLGRMYRRAHGLHVNIVDAAPPEPNDGAVAEIVSCVRELLMNVVKYAGVKEASIRLIGDGSDLRVEVVDKGAGFDPASLTIRPSMFGGFGLHSVLQRLAALGGRLEVTSAPGAGARVALLIPIKVTGAGPKATLAGPAHDAGPASGDGSCP